LEKETMISRYWRDNEGFFLAVIGVLVGWGLCATAHCQPCTVSPTVLFPLPTGTGTTPAEHDIVAPQGGNYVYVASQWGVLRAVVGGHPQQPGPFSLFGVGIVGGFPGGVIPIKCDCFAAWVGGIDAVESNGVGRFIGGWSPNSQGGNPPPGSLFSGLAAQVTRSAITQTFGQQINLPAVVPNGARVAAIQIGSKTFAYFPVKGQGVYLADISTPTGSAQWQDGIQTAQVLGWMSTSVGVRLRASSQGLNLLVGSTADLRLHVATIDQNTGIPTEVASTALAANPVNLDIGNVNGRTFVFSAEDLSGLRVYEYIANPARLVAAGTIAGRCKRVRFNQGVLFSHQLEGDGSSHITLYNTDWLTGGQQVQGPSIPDTQNNPKILTYGFDATVNGDGNAYIYREAVTTPEQSLAETTVSLGCLSGNVPTPTPTLPGPTVTPTPGAGGHIFQDWIYRVVAEGLMSACGPNLFCPGDAATTTHQGIVSRGQMSVFLLKSEHGANYVPPPCVPPGTFTDVPCAH
jgi:hypothetical protein